MRIVTGDHPDVWFDHGDLTAGSIIIIRRESITCCGFLGGDSVLVIRSGSSFADLLEAYRPVLPQYDREASDIQQVDSRRESVFRILRSPGRIRDQVPADAIAEWNELISQINRTVWFCGSQDPFRYELIVLGDIQIFLAGSVYPKRLASCLQWWYRNEATPDEKKQLPCQSVDKKLSWPEDTDLIIRAVNLYNHGTYELSGEFMSGEYISGDYLSGKN